MGFKVGKTRFFFINHPDLIRHVLQDHHRNYSKDTIQYNTLATITGRGLLTSDGEEWLRHRRMEQPAFARPRLANLDRVITPAVEAMLERWGRLADGEVLDVDREMMALTLEIVGQALFSIDLRQDAPRLTGAVLTALDHVIYRAQNPFAPPDWLPIPQNLSFRKALRQLDEAVFEIMENRRRSGEKYDDLLGMLMDARDEESGGAELTEQQIRDEIITLLIAGHETVASALTWSWYLLAQHPAVWEEMRREVEKLPAGRMPQVADLECLPLTAAGPRMASGRRAGLTSCAGPGWPRGLRTSAAKAISSWWRPSPVSGCGRGRTGRSRWWSSMPPWCAGWTLGAGRKLPLRITSGTRTPGRLRRCDVLAGGGGP